MSNPDISTACLFTFEFPVLYFSGSLGGGVPHLTLIKIEWKLLAALKVKSTG